MREAGHNPGNANTPLEVCNEKFDVTGSKKKWSLSSMGKRKINYECMV